MKNSLFDKLNKASNTIHEAKLKNNANYIVVSPEVAEIIKNLNKREIREKKLKRILNNEKSNNNDTSNNN